MTSPWYKDGLRFECTSCGACCQTHDEHAFVYLSDADTGNISKYLGMTRQNFLNAHCRNDDDGWTHLSMIEAGCNFLKADGHCEVYPVRPKQCETWPFWTENLIEEIWKESVSRFCPGVGRGRLYSQKEIEQIAKERDDWYQKDC